MYKIAVTKLLLYFAILNSVSCNEKSKQQHSFQAIHQKDITDVRSYKGNAFIFIDPDIYRERCFIIPVNEENSAIFKKLNIEDGIKGRLCIQMFFGRLDLIKLVNDTNKEMIVRRACNLPEDSMAVSRVYINYKDCKEITKQSFGGDNNLSSKDSCNSRLVERTDSTKFYFHIY